MEGESFKSESESESLDLRWELEVSVWITLLHYTTNDDENIASKHIFARWQAILSVFYFDIEYIKGSQNVIPDFLTREFLQCHHGKQAI